MISYAPDGEDVVLQRALGPLPGFFVDVGAGSPFEGSVTRHFYERGWHGIDVEPLAELAGVLREARGRDLVVGAAAAAESGRALLWRFEDSFVRSTLSPDVAEREILAGRKVEQLIVDVVTLDELLAEVAPPFIDFLRIAAEGTEREVISGIDLERWRPRVVVVRNATVAEGPERREAWEAPLVDRRYRFASTDGVNRYYVRDEDALLVPLLYPASTRDRYVSAEAEELRDEVRRLSGALAIVERERDRLAAELAVLPRSRASGVERARPVAALAPEDFGVELVDLERVLLVAAPESGSGILGTILCDELVLALQEAPHPADVRWRELDDRVLISLSWPYSEQLRNLVARHGFRVACVLRHPFDVLIATVGRSPQEPPSVGARVGPAVGGLAPTDAAFVDWATAPETVNELLIAVEWWSEPSALRVRYDELVGDQKELRTRLRHELEPSHGAARQLRALPIPHELAELDRPGMWRQYVDRSTAQRLLGTLGPLLERVGLGAVELETLPPIEVANSRWRQLHGLE